MADIVHHKTDNKADTVDDTLDKDDNDIIVVHETIHKENTEKKRKQEFSSDEDLTERDPNYESPKKKRRVRKIVKPRQEQANQKDFEQHISDLEPKKPILDLKCSSENENFKASIETSMEISVLRMLKRDTIYHRIYNLKFFNQI